MKRREIAVCILLWIVTCGFYGIYWMIVLNDEINTLSGRPGLGGGTVFLLSLLTCGIYEYIWLYQMGQTVDAMREQSGLNRESAPILYLLLGIFGFGIISFALMQNELNRYLD